MVVILAAGKGSRMKLKDNVSKCSVKIDDMETSVSRLIKQFYKYGQKKYVVIVGYGKEFVINGVMDSLKSFSTSVSCEFIDNSNYNKFGCEYSLSCLTKSKLLTMEDDLIIVEGDLVTSDDNIKSICENSGTCILARPSYYLSKRSVAISRSNRNSTVVSRFIYDPSHKIDFSKYPNHLDSMQVWKIRDKDLPTFCSLLSQYKSECDEGTSECPDASGLLSINTLCKSVEMKILMSQKPDEWMNLNTQKDVQDFKNKEWS